MYPLSREMNLYTKITKNLNLRRNTIEKVYARPSIEPSTSESITLYAKLFSVIRFRQIILFLKMFDFARFYFSLCSLAKSNICRNRTSGEIEHLAKSNQPKLGTVTGKVGQFGIQIWKDHVSKISNLE